MPRPKHWAASESSLARDGEAGEALAHRHQLDGVDVEVRRLVGDPPQQLRDVPSGHRAHPRVELVRRLLVAAGAHDGEFGLGHSRLDRGYANTGPRKVGAKVE